MMDPRVAKHADLLVNYSLGLGQGQIVRIDGNTVATPLITEVYRHAIQAGAHPRRHRGPRRDRADRVIRGAVDVRL